MPEELPALALAQVPPALQYAAMWDIVGQERALDSLHRALAGGNLPHALLLVGPSGVGKRRLGLEIAKALNCTGEDPPCGRCSHCHLIGAGGHPDVAVIEPLDGKDSIAIAQVRALREEVSLRPFQGRMKVYLIAQAEALTLQAADSLLKTLEEPPATVTIILTAADVDALPATVVSRCRVISLEPLERERISAALEQHGQPPERAQQIARLARGRMEWALEVAAKPERVAQLEDRVERLGSVLDLSLEARLDLAESLAGERKDRSAVRGALEILLLLARDLLLIDAGLPPQLAGRRGAPTLATQAARLGRQGIIAYLDRIRLTMQRVDANVDPRLALEALMMSLP